MNLEHQQTCSETLHKRRLELDMDISPGVGLNFQVFVFDR